MFSPDEFCYSMYTRFFIIYLPCIIVEFKVIEMSPSKIYTYQLLVWPWRGVWWNYINIVLLSWLVSNVYFTCVVHYCLYYDMDIGIMWDCSLVIHTPSWSIGLVFGCVFWCWVSLGIHFTLSFIECYFIMMGVAIIGILYGHIFHLNHVIWLSGTR